MGWEWKEKGELLSCLSVWMCAVLCLYCTVVLKDPLENEMMHLKGTILLIKVIIKRRACHFGVTGEKRNGQSIDH